MSIATLRNQNANFKIEMTVQSAQRQHKTEKIEFECCFLDF